MQCPHLQVIRCPTRHLDSQRGGHFIPLRH